MVSLVKLSNLQVNSNLTIGAVATLPNPLPYFNLPAFDFAFTPSFKGIALLPPFNSTDDKPPGSAPALPMVEASALKISITSTSKELTIPLHGSILAIPNTPAASHQMSRFLSTYLSGLPSPVLVSLPSLDLSVPFDFPPPHPKPKILEKVKLSNLKITLRGLEAFVSGEVDVRVAFPKGINLDVIVHRVTVDVITFDGPVPDKLALESNNNKTSKGRNVVIFPIPFPIPIPTKLPKLPLPIPRVELPWPWNGHYKSKPSPPPHPLPDPLPQNAFARIRPSEWLNATSIPAVLNDWVLVSQAVEEKEEGDGDDGGDEPEAGTRLKVHAEFERVPVKVLPGRDSVFRKFIGKVSLFPSFMFYSS